MKINRYPSSRIVGSLCTALLSLAALTTSAQQKEQEAPSTIISFTKAEGLKASDAAGILAGRLHLNIGTDELRSVYNEQPGDGLQVQRFNQYFKGIRVANGTYTLTSKDGIASYAFGRYYSIPAGTGIVPQMSEADALVKALAKVGAQKYNWEGDPGSYPKATLEFVEDYRFNAPDGVPHLAYAFDIYAEEPLSRNTVYVDAQTGNVLFMDAILKHIGATGATLYSDTVAFQAGKVGNVYYLHDSTRGAGLFTYNLNHTTNTSLTSNLSIRNDSSTTTFFALDAAVDAHWGATIVYDYWKNTHNRLSWDGANGILRSFVHYSTGYNNAMWNGAAMVYGDGTGSAGGGLDPLTALDVCGHEIGHGVCQSTASLVYNAESGAMNEGFSDIWGSVIEEYGNPHEVDAVAKDMWLIGEELGNTLRSMRNPKLFQQPDTYQGAYWVYAGPGCSSATDNCGVHTNSGVLNYWFYLLTDGGKGTNDVGNYYKVAGIGSTKSAKIVYATELALNSTANYQSCRTASIAAASTLYGACSPEVEAVIRAWYAVNVGSNYVPCTTQVSFGDITNAVSEDGMANACIPTHVVNIPVVLNGPVLAGDSAVVTVSAIGGTAVAGVDYTLFNPSVTFTLGGPTTKQITLIVIDNGVINPNKYIDLIYTLTAGGSNAIKSPVLDTTRVFIENDDLAPETGGPQLRVALTYNGIGNIGSPLMSSVSAARAQYIYKASELLAAGIRPNAPFTQAEFYVTAKYSSQAYTGYTMQMANTAQSSLSGGFVSGSFTTVYSGNLSTTSGWNAMSFSNPFVWNGTDNVVVEICFTNTTHVNGNDRVQAQLGSYTLAAFATSSAANGCSLPFNVNNLSGSRPLIRFSQNVPPSPIETAQNANRIWKVKAADQIYFYSDISKNLIAAIFDPTADLGCVTTTVTVAGNGFIGASGGSQRSVKEFKIIPAANVASPGYDAIFYMTNTEMGGIDPTKVRIVQTTSNHDSSMVAANTNIIVPNDVVYGLNYVGFRGTFSAFGRFYLTDGNLALGVGGVKGGTAELWTGVNPFHTDPVLYWNLPSKERVTIRMYDITGKMVYSAEKTLSAGSHQMSLAGNADYASGTYVLQVVRASGVFTKQLQKQ